MYMKSRNTKFFKVNLCFTICYHVFFSSSPINLRVYSRWHLYENIRLFWNIVIPPHPLQMYPETTQWNPIPPRVKSELFYLDPKASHGDILPTLSTSAADDWIPRRCSVDISVQFSRSVVYNSLQSHGFLHTRLPHPSPTPRTCSNSCSSHEWCHPTIWSSAIPFSSCLQSFPASRSFQMSQVFPSGGQSVGASASASVFPRNIQYWFPLGWTGWISLQSKGLTRVFSNTTVQKHQFFSAQLSL